MHQRQDISTSTAAARQECLRILLVEDESSIRALLIDCLRDEGFRVLEACSEQEATALLKTHRPDLLLTDIDLDGGGEGISVARMARVLWPAIAVVYISGRDAPPDDLRVPASLFMAKPFGLAALTDAVMTALAPAASPRE